MHKLSKNLVILFTTIWVGGLWAIGYLAVPVLFYAQPDRQLAGMLAAKMFTLEAYVGLACGIYLLAHRMIVSRRIAFRQSSFWIVVTMLLFTLLIQYGIQPIMADLKAQALPLEVAHSPFSKQFGMLHGISSVIYLVQSLLGLILVINSRTPKA